MKRLVVAGLKSNHRNNDLISILFLGSTNRPPHTLPHIFVNRTTDRLSFLVGKLINKGLAGRILKHCDRRRRFVKLIYSWRTSEPSSGLIGLSAVRSLFQLCYAVEIALRICSGSQDKSLTG